MPEKSRIKYIVLHTSDSRYANVDIIREWHLARGFSDIGYHYVVLNGFETGFLGRKRSQYTDGQITTGRQEIEIGAHAPGYNTTSLGICLVGQHGRYTDKQISSVQALILSLCTKYNILIDNVIGHYETKSGRSQGKTCPNILMNDFRRDLIKSRRLIETWQELNL